MKVGNTHYRSIWPDDSRRGVHIVDQTRLPFEFGTVFLESRDAVAHAIRTMQVRGAPLIGVTAAFGLALAMDADSSNASLEDSAALLNATRPTAVNLAWALKRAVAHLVRLPHQSRAAAAWALARKMADEDVATNAAIGELGAGVIRALHAQKQDTVNILTHCNTGWVATVDWGTALAAIYKAHDAGIPVHVWVDETRPRNQGLLTAWELRQHGVPHTYIVDNAGGHLMQHGKVDVVMVGADRVSRHGDVANKIGTYLKALAAQDNGVPFYAALPVSTIDFALEDALGDIEIEERDGEEVRWISGQQPEAKPQHGRVSPGESGPGTAPVLGFGRLRLLDEASPAANPAFDVTPSHLITGIITERGVFKPDDVAALESAP
ncbi:MAG: S-methyl-5-thioribose-1-phosphate isomerase [Betaproteobacteria bacterium]|nr:S-methyl-5-thioribose-1-phosphate isomerase [Betaproteobacteria bacterium]